jgi:hypothetical protein
MDQHLEECQALLEKWQSKLRLQDWHIKLKLADSESLQGKLGDCQPWLEDKKAIIRIIHPDDNPKRDFFDSTIEEILVHELLHLHFEPLSSPRNTTEMEQAINLITDALVNK